MIIDECLQKRGDFTVARHGISWHFTRCAIGWRIECSRARLEMFAHSVYLNGYDIEFEVENTGCATIHLNDFTIAYEGVDR